VAGRRGGPGERSTGALNAGVRRLRWRRGFQDLTTFDQLRSPCETCFAPRAGWECMAARTAVRRVHQRRQCLIWRERRGVMLATRGLASAVIRRPAHCTPPRGTLPPARVRGRATSCGIRIDTGVALLTTRARPRPSVTTAGTHTIHAHIWRGAPRLPNRIPRSVAFRAPSAPAQGYGSLRWPSSSFTSAARIARTSGRIPSGGR
jgi:hypothetical protein